MLSIYIYNCKTPILNRLLVDIYTKYILSIFRQYSIPHLLKIVVIFIYIFFYTRYIILRIILRIQPLYQVFFFGTLLLFAAICCKLYDRGSGQRFAQTARFAANPQHSQAKRSKMPKHQTSTSTSKLNRKSMEQKDCIQAKNSLVFLQVKMAYNLSRMRISYIAVICRLYEGKSKHQNAYFPSLPNCYPLSPPQYIPPL